MNTEYEEWQAELRRGPVTRDIHDWIAMAFQAGAVVAFCAAIIAGLLAAGGVL